MSQNVCAVPGCPININVHGDGNNKVSNIYKKTFSLVLHSLLIFMYGAKNDTNCNIFRVKKARKETKEIEERLVSAFCR